MHACEIGDETVSRQQGKGGGNRRRESTVEMGRRSEPACRRQGWSRFKDYCEFNDDGLYITASGDGSSLQ